MRLAPHDLVYVKLTIAGRHIILAAVDAENETLKKHPRCTVRASMPTETQDGVIAARLWEVLQWFGPHASIGKDVPFEWIEKV